LIAAAEQQQLAEEALAAADIGTILTSIDEVVASIAGDAPTS